MISGLLNVRTLLFVVQATGLRYSRSSALIQVNAAMVTPIVITFGINPRPTRLPADR